MMQMNSDYPQPEYQAVLDFWFGIAGSPGYGQERKEWFVKDAAFDAQIRDRFGALHARALAGELTEWEQAPRSAMALIILLDQFSRNMHRDTASSFAGDTRALALARRMVAQGWDAQFAPVLRAFIYLPFEHSEDLAAQEQALELFGRLPDEPYLAGMFEWARKHHEVIRRFGRFPHRNAILGRISTPEEEVFLRRPGSRF